MIIDALFSNVKVYDTIKLDVIKDEPFTLVVRDEPSQPFSLFADNDKVLEIDSTGLNVRIKATEIGVSTLLFMDSNSRNVIKEVHLNVIDEIKTQATDLGLTIHSEGI